MSIAKEIQEETVENLVKSSPPSCVPTLFNRVFFFFERATNVEAETSKFASQKHLQNPTQMIKRILECTRKQKTYQCSRIEYLRYIRRKQAVYALNFAFFFFFYTRGYGVKCAGGKMCCFYRFLNCAISLSPRKLRLLFFFRYSRAHCTCGVFK